MPFVADPTARLLILVVGAVLAVLAIALWLIEPHRRRDLLSQIAVIGLAWLVYFAVRGAAEADVSAALDRAHALEDFERAAGIYVEPWLNDLIARSSAATTVANIVYIWGHWPLILVITIWLFARHHSAFTRYKRAFLVSGAIGLVLFYLLPTAPPRLASDELIDTVSVYSRSYRVLQPPVLTNQYAAFPSLHVGWNLLIGIALARHAGVRVARLLGVLSPIAMGLAAVATGNHYVVDLAGGVVVALVGLGLVVAWERGILPRRRGRASELPDRAAD